MYGFTFPLMLTTLRPFLTLMPPIMLTLSLLLVELDPRPDGLWLVALPLLAGFLSFAVKLFTRTCFTCDRDPSCPAVFSYGPDGMSRLLSRLALTNSRCFDRSFLSFSHSSYLVSTIFL